MAERPSKPAWLLNELHRIGHHRPVRGWHWIRPSLLLSLGLIVVALALPALARSPEPAPPSLPRTLAPSIAPASSPVPLTSTAPVSHPAVSGHPSASSPPEDRQTRPPTTAKPQPARV